MRHVGPITIRLVAAAAIAGCGEDGDETRVTASNATPKATASARAAETVPAELEGTWEVTLRPSDVRNAPADLRGRTSRWQIEFHATGGRGDGPSLTVDNREAGTFVLPISVSGKRIEIEQFVECRAVSYAAEDDLLTFKPSDGFCVHRHSLPAILAARPWRRTA